MVYIILSIIGVAAVALLKPNWGTRKQLIFILAPLLTAMVVYVIIDFSTSEFPIEKGRSSLLSAIPWFEISLYFVMIAGMSAKYLFDAIGDGNEIKFQKWQLIKPVFISPIVFGVVYSGLEKETSRMLILLFSFQNGFFWQSVLTKNSATSK